MRNLISVFLLLLFSKDLKYITTNTRSDTKLNDSITKYRTATFMFFYSKGSKEECEIKKKLFCDNFKTALGVLLVIAIQHFLHEVSPFFVKHIVALKEGDEYMHSDNLPEWSCENLSYAFDYFSDAFYVSLGLLMTIVPFIVSTVTFFDFSIARFTLGLKVLWALLTCELLVYTLLSGFGIIDSYDAFHGNMPRTRARIQNHRALVQTIMVSIHMLWPLIPTFL